MKKIFGLFLALVAVITVSACGDKDKKTTKKTIVATTTTAKVTTTKATTVKATTAAPTTAKATTAAATTAKATTAKATTAAATTAATTTAATTTAATTTSRVLTAYTEVPQNVSLGMAVDYNNNGFVSYKGDNQITIPGAGTISKGDILPVWAQLGKIAGATFVDKGNGKNTNTNFVNAQQVSFEGIDIIHGNVSQLVEEGIKTGGKMVNLMQYFNFDDITQSKLPYLQQFILQNPTVLSSLISSNGAMYYAPYFDGLNEIENMILMNTDWVRNLLDGSGTGEANTLAVEAYQPTEPETNTYTVEALSNGEVKTYTKAYTQNVITLQNDTNLSGSALLSALKQYLNTTYADAFSKGIYTKLSDIYVGEGAGYDIDELVALMRTIKTNPKLASGDVTKEAVEVFFPRSGEANRCMNLARFMQFFNVRGMESRSEFFYIDNNGELQDARSGEGMTSAITSMNQMYREGLMPANYTTGYNNTQKTEWRSNLLNLNAGFMTYDYNATSTAKIVAAGDTDENSDGLRDDIDGFQAVLPPIVNWNDGDASTSYFHFTESSRSVKSDAWGLINTLEEAGNEAKLAAALRVIDYPYSPEGNKLMCYGVEGMYVEDGATYRGQSIPKFTTELMAAIKTADIDVWVYWRQYCGNTMNIGYVRDLSVEYQTLNAAGVRGIEMINDAINAGTLKIATTDGATPFMTLAPASLPFTEGENAQNNDHKLVNDVFTTGTGHAFSSYIIYGWGDTTNGTKTLAAYQADVTADFIPYFLTNAKAAYERRYQA